MFYPIENKEVKIQFSPLLPNRRSSILLRRIYRSADIHFRIALALLMTLPPQALFVSEMFGPLTGLLFTAMHVILTFKFAKRKIDAFIKEGEEISKE